MAASGSGQHALAPGVAGCDDHELVASLGRLDAVDVEHLAHETRRQLEERVADRACSRGAGTSGSASATPSGRSSSLAGSAASACSTARMRVVGRLHDRRARAARDDARTSAPRIRPVANGDDDDRLDRHAERDASADPRPRR